VPGISLANIAINTPFTVVNEPGDQVTFEPLVVQFIVDEEMRNWLEVWDWMTGLGFVREFKDFTNIKSSVYGLESDATMTILTANMNAQIHVKFENIFPISLSEIQFTSTDADTQAITATATFNYTSYTVERL